MNAPEPVITIAHEIARKHFCNSNDACHKCMGPKHLTPGQTASMWEHSAASNAWYTPTKDGAGKNRWNHTGCRTITEFYVKGGLTMDVHKDVRERVGQFTRMLALMTCTETYSEVEQSA